MASYKLLITNDDGPESPFLVPLLDTLASMPWCSELRIVIPAEEQSWIAGSVTRFKPVFVSEQKFGKHCVVTVSGTPSDCVSLGVFNLYPTKPDFVISGINMGTNASLPYFLSSGTVAAAVSASLTGMPGIALSVELPTEVHQPWVARNYAIMQNHNQDWERLSGVCVGLCEKIILSNSQPGVDFFSVNVPWEASATTKVVMTKLQKAHFQGIFAKSGPNQFRHQAEKLKFSKDQCAQKSEREGDRDTLERQEISVTAICYDLISNVVPPGIYSARA